MTPLKHSKSKSKAFDQACAVPYRRRKGKLELCLITSSAQRWSFPKGNIDPGEAPAETAIKEAWEEAGLHGHIVGEPLGLCKLEKAGQMNSVVVWLMKVDQCDDQWLEDDIRQRRWVTPEEARRLFCRKEFRRCLDAAVVRLKGKAA